MLTFSQIGLLTTTSRVRETDVFFTRQERSDPVSPAAGSFLARRAGERQAQEREAGAGAGEAGRTLSRVSPGRRFARFTALKPLRPTST